MPRQKAGNLGYPTGDRLGQFCLRLTPASTAGAAEMTCTPLLLTFPVKCCAGSKGYGLTVQNLGILDGFLRNSGSSQTLPCWHLRNPNYHILSPFPLILDKLDRHTDLTQIHQSSCLAKIVPHCEDLLSRTGPQ